VISTRTADGGHGLDVPSGIRAVWHW